MKKILYDNWIARTFLWGDYDTITLAAWVCTKYKNKEEMPQRIRNHECTHARQWVECMIASGVIILALVIFFGISSWWFFLSFLMFYALYVLEYLVKLMFFGSSVRGERVPLPVKTCEWIPVRIPGSHAIRCAKMGPHKRKDPHRCRPQQTRLVLPSLRHGESVSHITGGRIYRHIRESF